MGWGGGTSGAVGMTSLHRGHVGKRHLLAYRLHSTSLNEVASVKTEAEMCKCSWRHKYGGYVENV